MRIEWRKNQGQRPRATEGSGLRNRRRHLLILFRAEILPRHKSTEHHSWIHRIRRDVSVLIARLQRPPIMKIQKTVFAPAWCRRGPAILLHPIYPIRKLAVGR